MDAFDFLNKVENPEFDYLFLLEILSKYNSPRNQITKMIRRGDIKRVKKGIYVLGPKYDRPFSKKILANIIYGPSYLSGLWALSFYNLIPEKVDLIDSRTPQKNKLFNTTVGTFKYKYISLEKYKISLSLEQLDNKRQFLIATAEKVISEIVSEGNNINSYSKLWNWIYSMRIEKDSIKKLRISELSMINKTFNRCG